MAQRNVGRAVDEAPEIPEALEPILLAALNDAKVKLEAGEEVVPFTALAVKDKLFMETHPADDTEQCLMLARHTVQNARGADGYALCYDGYVETDAGTLDALIAEGGVPGGLEGYAVGYLYELPEEEDATPQVSEELVYIGPAPNFMMFTRLDEEEPEFEEDETEEYGE